MSQQRRQRQRRVKKAIARTKQKFYNSCPPGATLKIFDEGRDMLNDARSIKTFISKKCMQDSAKIIYEYTQMSFDLPEYGIDYRSLPDISNYVPEHAGKNFIIVVEPTLFYYHKLRIIDDIKFRKVFTVLCYTESYMEKNFTTYITQYYTLNESNPRIYNNIWKDLIGYDEWYNDLGGYRW